MLWYIFPKLMILFLGRAFSWIDYRSGSFFIYKTPEYKKVIKYDWEKLDFDPVETNLCNVLMRMVI
jgi:hypothetical protein